MKRNALYTPKYLEAPLEDYDATLCNTENSTSTDGFDRDNNNMSTNGRNLRLRGQQLGQQKPRQ